ENTAPGTKRRAGSSVYNSTLMAPLRPWALVRRATRSWVLPDIACLVVGVDHVDTNFTAVGQGSHQRAKCLRGAARATDHATEVLGVHAHLEDLATGGTLCRNMHIGRMVDNPLDEVLEGGSKHLLRLVCFRRGNCGHV